MTPRYRCLFDERELLAQVGEYDIYYYFPYYRLVWGTRNFQQVKFHIKEFEEHAKGYPGIKAWIDFGGNEDAHRELRDQQIRSGYLSVQREN